MREETIDIQLTPSQREYVYAKEQFPALVAGLGSGKTEAGILRTIMLMEEDPNVSCGFYLPTYDLLKRRAIPGFEALLEKMKIPFSTHIGAYEIKIHGRGSIIFRSYDRPERIVAYEVGHSIIDELDTLPKEKASFVWRKVTERNRQRGIRKNSIGLVTTPDQGKAGFTYTKWGGDILAPGYRLIKGKTTDNPFLPEGYIEQILSNYDPILAELYINGEFVSLNQATVYHCYNQIQHDTNREAQSGDVLHVGLDFNIGGTCAIVAVISGDKVYVVGEMVSHDTRDFVNKITSKYPNHTFIVYPDTTGGAERTNSSLSDLGILREVGLRIDAAKSNPVVRDRVNSVNGGFAHNKFFVNKDRCPNLVSALESQGYDKRGYPEKFDIHPAIDDWVDAFGYFIARKFPVVRPVLVTGIRSSM